MLDAQLIFNSMSKRLKIFCNVHFIHDSLYFNCKNDQQMTWVTLAIMNIKTVEYFQVAKFY